MCSLWMELISNEKMSYTLNEFDMNMKVFIRDWKIDSPIPGYLCTSLLHELSVGDLHRLQELIHGSWPQEIAARRRDGTPKSSGAWMTLTHRSWGNSTECHIASTHCECLYTIGFCWIHLEYCSIIEIFCNVQECNHLHILNNRHVSKLIYHQWTINSL